MTAPTQLWAVTEIAHPALRDWQPGPCVDCLALVDDAITIARATGSVGATAKRTTVTDSTHSATVHRAITMKEV